jgi:rhamnose utilization protein RhaD (predicted bifunctional aldolase and dehydrogenase)/NAD(P)-dependent dehydrogenase (short-subunit alcohol dehydrogenase family)
MENLWKDKDAKKAIKQYKDVSEDVALRVYTSRLIGAEPKLVLHGGGNTSVKSRTKNRLGMEVDVLYVKGSGWDLDTLEPPGLPGVQLNYLRQLRSLPSLSDEAMVNDQRTNLLDASSPNPSVETLLHAFLPHKFVDHSHADAILVIANQPNAKKICKEIYGEELGVVPYIMPGFDLAKAAAEAYEKNPQVKGLVLINHGLFTFGPTAKESYDAHIEAVTRAETFIKNHPRQPLTPVTDSGSVKDQEIFKAVAPVLRGLYREQSGVSWLVHHRESGPAREFASSKECKKWSQIGTATPDHVIRTKQKPLLLNPKHLDDPERLRSELKVALERYEKAYHKYFVTNQANKGVDLNELDPLPRVILVAGLGLVTIGKTVKETNIAADLYEHTIEIIQSAFDVGNYQPLPEADLFDMEYWSLEQAKLGKAQGPLLQGQVAYITGAASGIGLATAHLFAQKGANVYLVDLNGEALEEAGMALQKESKAGVTWRVVDLTDEEAVAASFDHAVQTYGGVDILISNAGNAVQGRIGDVDSATLRGSFDLNFFAHQTVAARTVHTLLKQKTGGALLFNASKAAFNPGKDFGPYALPKAALIGLVKQYALDYGKEGIRSNAVNADRIRTGMFTDTFIAERSKARGLEPEEYFRENLLGREVLDSDVAEAFLHLALSEKTTGSVFTVDGGNIAASPR